MSKTDKTFFPALTGYRAIAAWIIFVYHFMPFNSDKYPAFLKNIVGNFHIGVDMFFVLSGFLITYRYFNDHPIHIKKYMVNRIARIYPMYFLITAAVFGVWLLQNSSWNSEKTIEAILSFTMTKALFAKYSLTGIPQGWTLTLEELFYFTAPFYFILIRKNKWWLIGIPIIIFIFGTSLKTLTNIPENTWEFMQKNISTYIFEFFAGIGLGYLILKKEINFKNQWVTWFGLFFILFYLLFKHHFYNIPNFRTEVGRAVEIIVLSMFGIVPLLWGLIYERTIIQKILSTRTFVLLGKSSYIFYLIHKGFVPIFINDYISDNKLVIFVILNLISIGLFLLIEEPMNNLIRKKFGKAKT